MLIELFLALGFEVILEWLAVRLLEVQRRGDVEVVQEVRNVEQYRVSIL